MYSTSYNHHNVLLMTEEAIINETQRLARYEKLMPKH